MTPDLVQVTYKIIIGLHVSLVKKIRTNLLSSASEKAMIWGPKSILQKRDSKLKILLYEFGKRSQQTYNQKTLFSIPNRSLIDDQVWDSHNSKFKLNEIL